MQELQETDVLCVQEHWLYQYELKYLEDFHQDFYSHAKAVDEENPIPPIQKPRGYAGTSIFYKKHIAARKLKDGDHRIVCLEIQGLQPIILVSVYMPAKGSKARDEEYEVTLIGLDEIISRYKSTHGIIIAGDFNASLKTDVPDSRDRKLREFVANHNLSISQGHPNIPTYIKPDGKECSHLDYILVTSDVTSKNTTVKLLATNTSDHRPVHTELLNSHITPPEKKPSTCKDPSKSRKKVKSWDKVDVDEYLTLTEKEMEKAHLMENFNSDWEATTTLRKLTGILVKCKEKLTPAKLSRLQGRKKAPQIVWTPAIKEALSKKKKAFSQWKRAGRPEDAEHPLLKANKEAKKNFRKAQRLQENTKYQKDVEKIAEAKKINSKLFHKLVKLRSHSKVSPKVNELIVDGKKFTGSDIAEGWFRHFSKLAKPPDSPDNATLLESRDVCHIADICATQEKLHPVSQEEVTAAINDLNRKKAMDIHGLAAEHLRFCSPKVIAAITKIINFFRQSNHLPDQHKLGKLFPVYKKLNPENPYNHRGITILDLFCKLYEKLLKPSTDPILLPTQNKLQWGFTEDTSPLLAGLMLQEQIYEASEQKKPLYITFLDVKTAFDVVWHDSLLRKLYIDGIQGGLWLGIKSLYTGAETAISWDDALTDTFPVLQGVRQGAVLSADLYKRFNNPLLNMLSCSGVGGHIGISPLQSPTCADDIALCATDRIDMQCMIDVVHQYSMKEKYEIQARKSAVLTINSPYPHHPDVFYMGENEIPAVEVGEHLGVTRDSSGGPCAQIRSNIKKARGALYSLMGAGLHGKNGLPQDTCVHLYKIHVSPILTYGLGIFSVDDNDIKPMEQFQKTTLKQLLSLADNVADPTIHLLSGIPPVQYEIHRQALGFLGSIARKKSSVENDVARRQLIMKTLKSPSWFNYIKDTCLKYDLPSPNEILDNKTTKLKWKSQVKTAVNSYWTKRIIREAVQYPTLRYLNLENFSIGKPHTIIRHSSTFKRDVIKCATKLHLVTGTYLLQAHRARFNQFEVDPLCLLCREEPETREHFIGSCKALSAYRARYAGDIHDILCGELGYEETRRIMDSKEHFVQLILDCSSQLVTCSAPITRSAIHGIEQLTQRLVHSIHLARKSMLALISPMHRHKPKKVPNHITCINPLLQQQHPAVVTRPGFDDSRQPTVGASKSRGKLLQ